MLELLRDGNEQLPADCVGLRDPRLHHLLRHAFPYFLQIFVADAHRRLLAFTLIPGVRDAVAFDRLDDQIDWQAERAEYLLQGLQRTALLAHVVDFLMLGVLGRDVFDVDGRGSFVRGHIKVLALAAARALEDRKSTRLNSSHDIISYAVFCLK